MAPLRPAANADKENAGLDAKRCGQPGRRCGIIVSVTVDRSIQHLDMRADVVQSRL